MSDLHSERLIKEESRKDSIKHLHAEIQKVPVLLKQSKIINQISVTHLADIQILSSKVINQLKEQQKTILQRFDQWIMPIAKDVLDSILVDAEKNRQKLNEKFANVEQSTPEEWKQEADQWMELYTKWNDRKGLITKILEIVAERTKYLIARDIQIVKDYQTQSLSQLEEESEAFRGTEKRLEQAIEEPLKQLMALSIQPERHTSLQQASEWIANLQEKREEYFDQLLMKIDHVMKDVVQTDRLNEAKDWELFLDLEGDLVFMETELHQIKVDITKKDVMQESEKEFLLGRLEGLLDHLEELNDHLLPNSMRKRIEILKEEISSSIVFLSH